MDSFNFEFFKQVAIFTLKNDLKATEDEIKRFEHGLKINLQEIGAKMIQVSKEEKRRQQQLDEGEGIK